MNHIYLIKTLLVISGMLNLFYALVVVPGKKDQVEHWIRQSQMWQESYFKLLSIQNEKKPETWEERLQRSEILRRMAEAKKGKDSQSGKDSEDKA